MRINHITLEVHGSELADDICEFLELEFARVVSSWYHDNSVEAQVSKPPGRPCDKRYLVRCRKRVAQKS